MGPIARANAALARYDGLVGGLVNPDILLSALRVREAVLSSRIEGTQATLEEVLEYEADPATGKDEAAGDIREVLNYRKSIQIAVEELDRRPLSLNMIRTIHANLMTGARGGWRAPGEFRRVQNYIGPPGATIENASYVPPPVNELQGLLDNWERYLHADERDSLVQIGLAHAQFELIHPFLDGNGRVGRILIPLFLFAKRVIHRPAFYLSAYFEAHRADYYDRLAAISRDGDHLTWLEFFLTAVHEQAEEDTDRVVSILALFEVIKKLLDEQVRTRYTLRIIDALFGWPLFSTSQLAQRAEIPPATAARLLRKLETIEVVRVVRLGRGRRPTVWSFPKLLHLVQ